MARTYNSYDGTPGTTERGRAERARQDSMIAAAGGIVAYVQGARPRGREKHVDAGALGVIQYKQPRDTSGGKLSA